MRRLGVLGLVALAAISIAGCKCDRRTDPGPRAAGSTERTAAPVGSAVAGPRRELLVLDFTGASQAALLSLWPADPKAPERTTHELEASAKGDVLQAKSGGVDPWFQWQFAAALEAGSMTLDVDSDRAGNLQVFWTSGDCPNFDEACSIIHRIEKGRHQFDLVIGVGQPVRALRFDLIGEQGAVLKLHGARLSAKPLIAGRAEPRVDHTKTEASAEGLIVTSTDDDPWLVFQMPALALERATGVELELVAPAGTLPHFFWSGAGCADFEERCGMPLRESGPGRYSATLVSHPEWKGRIVRLRLDPGDLAGRYVLKRFALVRGS